MPFLIEKSVLLSFARRILDFPLSLSSLFLRFDKQLTKLVIYRIILFSLPYVGGKGLFFVLYDSLEGLSSG